MRVILCNKWKQHLATITIRDRIYQLNKTIASMLFRVLVEVDSSTMGSVHQQQLQDLQILSIQQRLEAVTEVASVHKNENSSHCYHPQELVMDLLVRSYNRKEPTMQSRLLLSFRKVTMGTHSMRVMRRSTLRNQFSRCSL